MPASFHVANDVYVIFKLWNFYSGVTNLTAKEHKDYLKIPYSVIKCIYVYATANHRI